MILLVAHQPPWCCSRLLAFHTCVLFTLSTLPKPLSKISLLTRCPELHGKTTHLHGDAYSADRPARCHEPVRSLTGQVTAEGVGTSANIVLGTTGTVWAWTQVAQIQTQHGTVPV